MNIMAHVPRDEAKGGRKWQMSYNDGDGKQNFMAVLPVHELERLRAQAKDRKMSMSRVVRDAVFSLARDLKIVSATKAEHLARQLAAETDAPLARIADAVDLRGPRFRPTLERIAERGNMPLSHALRWALNVYFSR